MDSQAAVVDERFTHLSAFALNGRDGHVRWHHVVGDFEKTHAKVYMYVVASEIQIHITVIDFYILPVIGPRYSKGKTKIVTFKTMTSGLKTRTGQLHSRPRPRHWVPRPRPRQRQ